MTQLGERFRLDLADALAGDAELLADLLERAHLAVVEPEAQAHDLPLPVVELLERLDDRLGEQRAGGGGGRGDGGGILDEVAEEAVVLLPYRRLERHRLLRDALDLPDAVRRHLDLDRDLLDRWLTSELLEHLALDPQHLVHRLDHVHRDPDRARLVGDRASDRLPDPPRRVGRELEALRVVELLDGADQAEVALLDEVEQGHAATDVPLGDRDDEPEVGLGELPLGELTVDGHGLETGLRLLGDVRLQLEPLRRMQTGFDALRQRDLLLSGQQRHLSDLLEVHAHGIEAADLTGAFGAGGGLAQLAEPRHGLLGAGRRAGTGDHTARSARLRAARAMRRPRLRGRAPLVLALELLGDLVDDLDAPRADARVDGGELGGLGLETGEGGEDLAGGDEAAFLDPLEQGFDATVPSRVVRSSGRGIGSAGRRARRRFRFVHAPTSSPPLRRCRSGRRPTLPTARRHDARLPSRRSRDGASSRTGAS